MSKKILTGKRTLQIGRAYLLFSYYSLLLKSFSFYRLKKRGNSATLSCKFLGYEVRIQELSVFIYLIEEIFVDEVYAFYAAIPNPSIIDCGSNIGVSVMYFKCLYPDASVLAFEPDPDAFTLLERNVQRNGLSNVTLMKCGLGQSSGEQLLFKDINRPLNASIIEGNSESSVTVKVVRLSDYINVPVDLAKIDVEGSEGVITENLIQSKKIQNVRAMIIEFHPDKIAMPIEHLITMIKINDIMVSVRPSGKTDYLLYCKQNTL